MDGLLAMHSVGIAHRDIDIRNMVVQNVNNKNKLFFIDFGRAIAHDCLWEKTEFNIPHEDRPDLQELACPELFRVCEDMGIFRPGAWTIMCSSRICAC